MSCRLQDRLTTAAARRPDACALVFGDRRTTYLELEESSNRLARALKIAGCQRGDRVALLLPKSIEAIIAIFGVLKAECIYVPLDTASPAARLVRILESCECRCLLAVQPTATLLEQIKQSTNAIEAVGIGWMDDCPAAESGQEAMFSWRDMASLSGSPVESATRASDAAHILFTSGSTGTPKGVMITHSNVIHFVDWAIRYFEITPSDRLSGHPPLHFDLSTFDIHGAVAAGAQLHLVPPELNLLPHWLAAFMRDSEVTQWFSVPSILNQMAKFDVIRWSDFPALRRLLWCGEKFPTPGLIHWMQRLPHVSFFNLYGPTEATIASSCYRVPSCPSEETVEIPLGEACQGERLMVRDERLQPVNSGETGDLYIAGEGLSPGYWRDSRKTGEVFLTDPNGSDGFRRIYKTGDLAKVGNDGHIYLVGRSDSQIKSRGYRIELGEIESAIHAEPEVRQAAVVSVDSTGFEGAVICCAYVPMPGSYLPPTLLKKRLGRVLPRYMLPARWMVLDRIPLNGNGKTDRPWLKEQFRQQPGQLLAKTETASAS